MTRVTRTLSITHSNHRGYNRLILIPEWESGTCHALECVTNECFLAYDRDTTNGTGGTSEASLERHRLLFQTCTRDAVSSQF